ncbi:MAG TPA: hypothetical protein VNM87_04440, partial [Candidatus Udaeobacter sp.]|nr:hypothetical protein [Candidatus Udaeobacter sp.]
MKGRGWQFALVAAALTGLLLASCGDDGDSPPEQTRTYRMGFSGIPPRADEQQAIAAIDLWSLRA